MRTFSTLLGVQRPTGIELFTPSPLARTIGEGEQETDFGRPGILDELGFEDRVFDFAIPAEPTCDLSELMAFVPPKDTRGICSERPVGPPPNLDDHDASSGATPIFFTPPGPATFQSADWFNRHAGPCFFADFYDDHRPTLPNLRESLLADWESCPAVPVNAAMHGPQDAEPSNADMASLDFELVLTEVGLDQLDPRVFELLYAAWAVLRNNLDLLEWLSCLFDPDLFECLLSALSEQTIRLIVGDTDKSSYRVANGHITLEVGCSATGCSGFVRAYLNRYLNSSADNRLCIVVDLAATLLHELLHICSDAVDGRDETVPGDAPNTCGFAYMVENSFRWAMGRRIPALLNTNCCSNYGVDYVFMNDGTIFPCTDVPL